MNKFNIQYIFKDFECFGGFDGFALKYDIAAF
jgi:hypothetical protein